MSVGYCARNGRQARIGGFTLIELLVVIAVIAILAAILFPVFLGAKASAQRTKCVSNLKQINIAWQLYADDNNGRACPACDSQDEMAWDFMQDGRPGFLARYTRSGEINRCPSFHGESWGRPATGYAYNASYIGGDPKNSSPLPTVPCYLGQIAHASRKVVFADAGFGNPASAHNFLRSPRSKPIRFYAGAVHFRHGGYANVAYADGHVASTNMKYRCDPVDWPECGTLSDDESAYDLN